MKIKIVPHMISNECWWGVYRKKFLFYFFVDGYKYREDAVRAVEHLSKKPEVFKV